MANPDARYCNRYLDDAPGIRGDCEGHLRGGRKCLTCPHRNIHQEVIDLRAAVAANGWRPIKDAPKDGSKIIVWDNISKEPVCAYWKVTQMGTRRARNPDVVMLGYWAIANQDHFCVGEPTLWMPYHAPQ